MSKRRKRNSGNPQLKKSRRKPKRSPIQKLIAAIAGWPGWFWIVLLSSLLVGIGLGYLLLDTGFRFLFGKFLPQYPFSLPWFIAFLATSIASLFFVWRRGRLLRNPDKGPIRRAWQLFLGVMSILIVNVMLVFMAGPWLIHQVAAEPARVVVTVTRTDAVGGRRECSPRVEVDLYGGSTFCPTRTFFRSVKRGDQLLLEGRVSPHGFSVHYYSHLSSRAGCPSRGSEQACSPVPIWL